MPCLASQFRAVAVPCRSTPCRANSMCAVPCQFPPLHSPCVSSLSLIETVLSRLCHVYACIVACVISVFTFELSFTFKYKAFQGCLLVAGSLTSPVSEPAAEASPEAPRHHYKLPRTNREVQVPRISLQIEIMPLRPPQKIK